MLTEVVVLRGRSAACGLNPAQHLPTTSTCLAIPVGNLPQVGCLCHLHVPCLCLYRSVNVSFSLQQAGASMCKRPGALCCVPQANPPHAAASLSLS